MEEIKKNKYENGKIYMIESLSSNLVYYGSTCSELCKRLSKHVYAFNHSKGESTASKVLCNADHKIILVEYFPCNTREELTARESHYIRNNECVNKNIPGRTIKEWYNDNREEVLRKQKIISSNRYENNKESIKEWHKNYYEENKEKYYEKIICGCGGKYNYTSKIKHSKTRKHINYHKNLIENQAGL